MERVETPKGRYVTFLAKPGGDVTPYSIGEFGGVCEWDRTRNMWAVSMREEAYAKWVLKQEFDSEARNSQPTK